MNMTQKTLIPREINDVVTTLEKAGFEGYLVGGCVRDTLLGRKPKDWDITTNAKPEEIQKLFVKTVYENSFGTVVVIDESTEDPTLRNIEVTPYRLESTYSDRRRPDQVHFSDKIEDDLKRRDFTINAVAMSLSSGAIKDVIDLYGGFKDFESRIIKTVGEPRDRFNEDALRMMRAVRLAVELDFSIDKPTFSAISELNSHIKDISIERIRDEFSKILMSKDPKKGIEMLQSSGLLKHFIPELEAGMGVEQNQAHKFDVWEHLLRSLQHAADKEWPLDIRLAALFHDIAKPQTRRFSRETNQYTFYGHEVVGSRETRKILERMRFSRVIIEKVVKLVRWHMFFSDTEQINLSAVRRMIVNVGHENIWDLMNVRICDRIGTGRPKEDPYRLRKYKAMVDEALRDPISLAMMKRDGKAIMEVTHLAPGPKVGYILHAIFDEILSDPKLNTTEYIDKRAIELASMNETALKALGTAGAERKREEDKKDIEEIRKKYHVS
ncbi:MAG: HD domain-containing protein [Patescibacteria group bacterium]